MLELQPKANRSRLMLAVSPVLALLSTVVMGYLLFLYLGKDPVRALQILLLQPFSTASSIGELIVKGTPLLLIAPGLSLGFKAKVWNIGAEGQFIAGALGGGAFALAVYPTGGWWLLPAMCLIGTLCGVVWAAIPAFLRTRFNASEILVSLMLSYVAVLFLSVMVAGPLRDPSGINMPESRLLQDDATLPILISGTRGHIGILIALAIAILFWILDSRHLIGFQGKVFGQAPEAALYGGFTERQVVFSTLLISGGLAGLAGVLDVAGPNGQLTDRISVGYGFTAIIVAFLGQLHPLGIVIASVVMAATYIGGEQIQFEIGMSASITSVFQGLLLLNFLAFQLFVDYRVEWKHPSWKRGGQPLQASRRLSQAAGK